ncbi:MAG: hypothetical protein AB9Q22_10015 [Candidatus Reddybacter sp.]
MTNTETLTVMMPRALTAENGAKHALIGEFFELTDVPCPDCEYGINDEDCETCEGHSLVQKKIYIEWTTIKDIYKKAVELLGN